MKHRFTRLQFIAYVSVALIGSSPSAQADPVYVCELSDLIVCGDGIGCSNKGSAEVDFPRRFKVDLTSGRLSSLDDAGNLRESIAENKERREDEYYFQAIQTSRREGTNVVGWSLFFSSKSKKISGSAVNADVIFNVFGSCESSKG